MRLQRARKRKRRRAVRTRASIREKHGKHKQIAIDAEVDVIEAATETVLEARKM